MRSYKILGIVVNQDERKYIHIDVINERVKGHHLLYQKPNEDQYDLVFKFKFTTLQQLLSGGNLAMTLRGINLVKNMFQIICNST